MKGSAFTLVAPLRFELSRTASSLMNAVPHRFYAEPGYKTGIERRAYLNGRVFGAALRYGIGN